MSSSSSSIIRSVFFDKNTLMKIRESKSLTGRGWRLIFVSSIITAILIVITIAINYNINLNISIHLFIQRYSLMSFLISFTIIILYNLTLAFSFSVVDKSLTLISLKNLNKWQRDEYAPSFNLSIRLLGHTSIILILAGIALIIGTLVRFEYVYLIFILFLIWHVVVYSLGVEIGLIKSILGVILSFFVLLFSWILFILILMLASGKKE